MFPRRSQFLLAAYLINFGKCFVPLSNRAFETRHTLPVSASTTPVETPTSSSQFSVATTGPADERWAAPAADPKLNSMRDAQRTLMAPLMEVGKPGSKSETFIRILNSFMMDYAESAYEAGYSIEDFNRIIGMLLSNVAKNMRDPFKFDPFHKAVRAPNDFYKWAQSFMNTLILWEDSPCEGLDTLEEINALVASGDNVILLANHQTEADPQVATLMLERQGMVPLAEKMVFVAGHKVTTDPLAIPFSMGCNLLCIHSKKYLDLEGPEQKAIKQQQNMDTMSELQGLLASGGNIVWVAPSGGRDRTSEERGGEFAISSFDAKSVELFRLMATKAAAEAGKRAPEGARVPQTHVFTLAMLTRKCVPPPAGQSGAIGETRTAKLGSVGIKFGCKLTDEMAQSLLAEGATKAEKRGAFTSLAEAQVKADYEDLLALEKSLEAGDGRSGTYPPTPMGVPGEPVTWV